MPKLVEEYQKWRDELSLHLKKLRDILVLSGMVSEDADDIINPFLEEMTTVIADLSSDITTYTEEEGEPAEE